MGGKKYTTLTLISKKTRVVILPSDKLDFRAKDVTRDRVPFHNDKGVNL